MSSRVYLNFVAAGGLFAICSCAHPAQDYDDFRSRVSSSVDAALLDSGPAIDTAPDISGDGSIFDDGGVGAYNGQYLSECLDASYKGDSSKISYSLIELKFEQAADGTVTVSGFRRAIKNDATLVTQNSGGVVSLQASGNVSPAGTFTLTSPKYVIPLDSNPIGLDLTVESGVYKMGIQSSTFICGNFTGKITDPIPTDINETCMFTRVGPDGAFTRLTTDPHCP